jgi:hypothetical protein
MLPHHACDVCVSHLPYVGPDGCWVAGGVGAFLRVEWRVDILGRVKAAAKFVAVFLFCIPVWQHFVVPMQVPAICCRGTIPVRSNAQQKVSPKQHEAHHMACSCCTEFIRFACDPQLRTICRWSLCCIVTSSLSSLANPSACSFLRIQHHRICMVPQIVKA